MILEIPIYVTTKRKILWRLKKETYKIKIKGIDIDLEISGIGMVEYSFSSEIGCMIVLQAETQAYYVPGLPK